MLRDRHHDGPVWSFNRFQDANAGLVLAKVKTDDPDWPIDLPPWVGAEVMLERRFGNSHLARWPVSNSHGWPVRRTGA